MLGPITMQDVFSTVECADIIALAQTGGLTPAGLVQGRSDGTIRTSRLGWLDDGGGSEWVMRRVVATVADANRRFGFDLTDFAERIQVAHYAASETGHFDWHSDSGSGTLAARRKLTLVVQLSDPQAYTGGMLETWSGNKPAVASRQQGTAMLFPAFVLHRVTPVSKGERWSLTTWVHGPGFR